MKPRLATSKEWTPFPEDLVQNIREATQGLFNERLARGRLFIEGRIYPQELLLRLGYLENQRLKQANFEASIEYRYDRDNVMEVISTTLDALAAMMEAYFESEEAEEVEDKVEFPRQWQAFDFLKRTLYLQFSTTNTELEAIADHLLGLSSAESLVRTDLAASSSGGADEGAAGGAGSGEDADKGSFH